MAFLRIVATSTGKRGDVQDPSPKVRGNLWKSMTMKGERARQSCREPDELPQKFSSRFCDVLQSQEYEAPRSQNAVQFVLDHWEIRNLAVVFMLIPNQQGQSETFFGGQAHHYKHQRVKTRPQYTTIIWTPAQTYTVHPLLQDSRLGPRS